MLYVGRDAAGQDQLYRLDGKGDTDQLTAFEFGVRDYTVAPDGRQIAVAVNEDGGGTVIWTIDVDGPERIALFRCGQTECANLEWAPDAQRILFEKRLIAGDGTARSPTLWWLDTKTAEARPVLQDESDLSMNGRLSPDGQWLSYVSPNDEGMSVYNFEDGRSYFIVNEIGAPGAWSPDGKQLVVPRFDLVITHGDEGEDHLAHEHGYQTAVHLSLLDVESGNWRTFGGDLNVEDSVPAWSPDGEWIAFGRRVPRTGSARQLWIVRADGSEARALIDDPLVNHGPPVWTPDGRYILFQQTRQDEPSSVPGIWRIDPLSRSKEKLIEPGMQPAWLP